MASFRTLWSRLLRVLGMHRAQWVEPSNAVTRAIYEGSALVTMATFEQPAAAAPPVPETVLAQTAAPQPEPEAVPETAEPKRPGVAA